MADERIDIEVTDKVAASIPTKLREIADQADRGTSSLAKLKSALASLPTGQLAALSAAGGGSASAIKELTNAINGLDSRLGAASSAAREMDSSLSRVTSSASAASKALGNVERGAQESARELKSAAAAGRTYATTMQNVSGATGLAGHQMGNLVAQLNDIGVSLAGGQNPLLVLIQQGSQIQYLASTVEGGFRTLLKATTALVIGQQQVSNAATAAAAANVANASAATAAATAQATQAGIAANLVLAEQAVAVAQTEAGATAARLAVAEAALSSARAAVAQATIPTLALTTALAQAELAQATAAQAATVANAELAAAQLRLAASAEAAAIAELQLAQATAGTALGLGVLGAALVGLGAVLVPLAAKFSQFHDEINRDAGLKEYVNTLGLTKKELKELEDVTVTYGDMASGTWMTIKEGLAGLAPVFEAIGAVIMGIIDLIWNTLKNFSFGLQALFKGTYRAVITIWNQFPAAFADLFARAANAAIGALEWIANKAVDVLNYLGGSFEQVTLKRWQNANAGAAAKMGADLVSGYTDAFNEAEAGYNSFVNRVGQNSQKAARDRLAAQARGIIDERTGSGGGRKGAIDRTAENRANALKKVNLELDNEISRMKMLKDERAIQQRYDQIEEQLASKKIKLSQGESLAIMAKVTAIEKYKYVQAESDRIMEEAIGPQRTMNAAVDAATDLYDKGKIGIERYTEELRKATREHAKATDPLFAMNEELDSAARIANNYGVALERTIYLEGVRQTLADKGKSIYDATTGAITAEVAALVAKNDALRQQQYIQSQLGDVLNPILEQQRMLEGESAVYAELQRLRDQDKINEDAYQRAKLELQNKYNEMRLSSMSSFFGDLASVTAQGNGAIGVISKAAAVAQATIDGFVATQKALASAPPPWNYIAAAGVALKTGANVAGILSTNVGSFNTGGQFTVGGKSGIDANNINMNVTKGERVTIETMKQQRANDNQPQSAPIIKQKIVNQFDAREFVSAMDSEEGEDVIINVISRRKAEVAQITAGGAG